MDQFTTFCNGNVICLVYVTTGHNLHSHNIHILITKLNNKVSYYRNATIGD